MNEVDGDPGFAVWPKALSEGDVSLLLSALDESPSRSRAGVRHLMSNPRIAELAADPRLLALVHPVLGTNARPYRATLFHKSIASNWPGTHHRGVLSDAAIQKLARESPAVECTVARGGVVSMRPLLVHASSKATAPAPRRVLHIEYATATGRRPSGVK
jgi:hypothetical protein